MRPRPSIVGEYVAVLATAYGRKTAREVESHLDAFFAGVDKDPDDVSTADVLGLLRHQEHDAQPRLRSVIGLFVYIESGTITDPLEGPASRSEPR